MDDLTKIEIVEKLNKSLDKLYIKDWYLFNYNVHEISITHKLAEYLQDEFSDYDVDCEYNRDITNTVGDSIKQIYQIIKKEIGDYEKFKKIEEKIEYISRNIYPDIIVHKRGTNNHNLLAIEAIKRNPKTELNKSKLEACTQNNSQDKLNFNLVLLLKLSVGEKFSRNEVEIIEYPFKNIDNKL